MSKIGVLQHNVHECSSSNTCKQPTTIWQQVTDPVACDTYNVFLSITSRLILNFVTATKNDE